YNVHKHTDGKC
ncbi:Transposable element Tcb1 transposase, partial [Araneus ventricosus]